jgi:hypothetical protein
MTKKKFQDFRHRRLLRPGYKVHDELIKVSSQKIPHGHYNQLSGSLRSVVMFYPVNSPIDVRKRWLILLSKIGESTYIKML